MTNALVESKRDALHALCREHGVERLALFGSATTDRFGPDASDLDFLVSFADRSPGYARRYPGGADEWGGPARASAESGLQGA